MFHFGLELFCDKRSLSFRISHVSHCGEMFAIADMNKAMLSDNPSKPKVMQKSALMDWVKQKKLAKRQYKLPAIMSFSDEALIGINKAKWIEKRDLKWDRINTLCSDEIIQQYLYGIGISKKVDELVNLTNGWNCRSVFYHALNRYITFGCTKNALLPFKLKNVGSNYLHFEKPSSDLVKRGRGKSDNSNSLSKSRGITNLDKQNIIKTVRKMNGKFTLKAAYEKFCDTYERSEIQRRIGDQKIINYLPFDKEQCISYQQFSYHLKKLCDPNEILKKRVGNLKYEKDIKPKQGSSLDGVLGATHRYEVDATVLDLYVRYPFDKKNQVTMGRPVLYIVVDVYSTMIVGFYLGFDGPNWQGAAQALVNACSNKVEFAASFGECIEESDWPANYIPSQITIDNGPEYPISLISTVLKSELGVQAFNYTAVYRGDAKGTVEGTFNILNNEFVHFQPGSIFKNTDRGEKHPSNCATLSYEDVVKKLIYQIIYHNNSAERLDKFNWQAIYDDIKPTPQAIFLHSIDKDMDGGRATSKEDMAHVYWGFLPEEQATIQKDGLKFQGVMFSSKEAERRGFFSKAMHGGRYKIPIKRSHLRCDNLWHKTPDGEFIRFEVKNVNNGSPFVGIHWSIVEHLIAGLKQKKQEHIENKRFEKARRDSEFTRINENSMYIVSKLEKSDRKSPQPGISERKEHQQAINQQREEKVLRQLLQQSESGHKTLEDDGLIDLNNELFE